MVMEGKKILNAVTGALETGLLLALLLISSGELKAQHRHIHLHGHLVQHGKASFYANSFNGQETSNGDVFTNKGMTAASNTLPLGTVVKVTNLNNHKWVVVVVNDRMSPANHRLIDLTRSAARKLSMVQHGVTKVRVQVIPRYFYRFFDVSPEEMVAYGQGKRSDAY
jgi:rare lipoprotein A (peptidoglycan hydrolase)